VSRRPKRVPKVKHVVGLLYVTTALLGFYWSVYLTLTQLYGVPFSGWYILIGLGAAVLLLGAILWWVSNWDWIRWLPVAGSALLAIYFVPAGAVLIRQGRLDLIRAIVILWVVLCFAVAVKERMATANLR
jgi:hypothetical protein